MRALQSLVFASAAALSFAGCVGTTGSDLVTFEAAAAGPADAVKGQPYSFTSGRGFHVTLTKAKLHVGGVYLSRSRPTSGAQETDCILPGLYVGEVPFGLDVDVLSPEPQLFPGKGEGTADPAAVGEVWLSHGDVNAPDDSEPVLEIAGTAEKAGASFPFEASITIGSNRAVPVTDPSMPSQHPICKERIVSPIAVSLTPENGGSLLLRIDPRGWFSNVDFTQLDETSTSPPLYSFADENDGQPNVNLYRGLQARFGVYDLEWKDTAEP